MPLRRYSGARQPAEDTAGPCLPARKASPSATLNGTAVGGVAEGQGALKGESCPRVRADGIPSSPARVRASRLHGHGRGTTDSRADSPSARRTAPARADKRIHPAPGVLCARQEARCADAAGAAPTSLRYVRADVPEKTQTPAPSTELICCGSPQTISKAPARVRANGRTVTAAASEPPLTATTTTGREAARPAADASA